MENFGKFMTILILLVVGVLVGGFMFMKFYEWFIVPIYNVPELRFIDYCGIAVFVSYITYKKRENKNKNEWSAMWNRLLEGLVYSGLFLFIAWLISLFI